MFWQVLKFPISMSNFVSDQTSPLNLNLMNVLFEDNLFHIPPASWDVISNLALDEQAMKIWNGHLMIFSCNYNCKEVLHRESVWKFKINCLEAVEAWQINERGGLDKLLITTKPGSDHFFETVISKISNHEMKYTVGFWWVEWWDVLFWEGLINVWIINS